MRRKTFLRKEGVCGLVQSSIVIPSGEIHPVDSFYIDFIVVYALSVSSLVR